MSAIAPPELAVLPDYAGGSIANLMQSIAAAFGVPAAVCPPLAEPLPALSARRDVVLIVVDGLGRCYLAQEAPGSALAHNTARTLTSVFPSTTASAITTFLTGATPTEHGLIGWHLYFEEIDAIGAVLPFRMRGSDEPLSRRGLAPGALLRGPTLLERLPAQTHVVSPRKIADSDFNVAHSGRAQRHAYASLAEFGSVIERCLRAPGGRRFVYAYWPELDSIAHEYGANSRQAGESLRRFDTAFARLLASLRGSDATVLVTGDHGLVDAPESDLILLEQHPRLAAMLARPLSGERRVAYCHVRPDAQRAFEDYVGNELGERATLHRSESVLASGWFGPGTPHPRLASRVGDYVLVMNGRATIKDWLPGEKRYRQIGVHGGLSGEEMLVPLVVIEP
jgi:hypothetical protein